VLLLRRLTAPAALAGGAMEELLRRPSAPAPAAGGSLTAGARASALLLLLPSELRVASMKRGEVEVEERQRAGRALGARRSRRGRARGGVTFACVTCAPRLARPAPGDAAP